MSYSKNSLSIFMRKQLLMYKRNNANRLLQSIVAFSHVLIMILALSGDVHPNPGPNDNLKDISVCHVNVRSLGAEGRMESIQTDLADKHDIIAVTETWLLPTDDSSKFNLSGFQSPIRKDRNFGQLGYGGVLLWVSNSIVCKRRPELEVQGIEAIWVEIRKTNMKFLICVIYRANSNTNLAFWDRLQDNIDMVSSNNMSKIMIIGDLNADPKTQHGKRLSKFAASNNLTLHINAPTRITETTSSLLDQMISNFPNYIHDVRVDCPIANCDHCVISAKLNLKSNRSHSFDRKIWSYTEESMDNFLYLTNHFNWTCTSVEDPNEACELFISEFLDIVQLTIPSKHVTIRANDKPWFNSKLRNLKKKCIQKFNTFKRDRKSEAWEDYKEMQKNYQKELMTSKRNFETKQFSSISENVSKKDKQWWKLVKEIMKSNNNNESIPNIVTQGQHIDNNKDKAQAFNDFFLGLATSDDTNATLPVDRNLTNANILNSISITEKDVLDQLQILDTNKAQGPDGISPKLLKKAAKPLAKILQYIFNLSLKSSTFPVAWKKANVIPVYKKGDKTNINNYRPVSLLSIVAKIFERIVFKYVYNHFRDNFVLSVHQSGFLPGCSTETQLLEVYHKFCKAVDQGKEVRVVFLDISKAFDKVWHKGLLYKLQRCGIGGVLLDWFSSYLSDRQQRVVINGENSAWGQIKAGVPQGSVLGPLLFLIYINDITQVVKHSCIRLFADDTCLFIEVDNRMQTAKKVEWDLSSIEKWAKNWLVTFSPQKTKSLTISNKRDAHLNPPLKFMDSYIDEVSDHKYLGLTLSNNLKFDPHIDSVCLKARQRLSIIQSLKFKLDRKTLETIYFAFILPVVEYGKIVWGGSCDTHIDKIEKLHVDAMRLVTGATARSNIQRLYAESGWQTIRARIDMAMVIMLFKIKNHCTPNYLYELLPQDNVESICYDLRNNDNIRLPHARREALRRSFFPSAIRLWNKLKPSVRNSPSLCALKMSLRKELPDKPVLYYYGKRWTSVHHARLRMECSKLNFDLSCRLYVRDSPACRCGAAREDASHFFFDCPYYADIRNKLFAAVTEHAACNLKTLLFGNEHLSIDDNRFIFDAVQEFIDQSNRFL